MAVACFSHVLKRLQLFCLCSFLVVALAGIAYADGDEQMLEGLSPEEIQFFEPLNTLYILSAFDSHAQNDLGFGREVIDGIVQDVLVEASEGGEWLTITPLWTGSKTSPWITADEKSRPNVAVLTVTISTRKMSNASAESLTLGSVTAKIYSKHAKRSFADGNLSVPFPVSTDKESNIRQVHEWSTPIIESRV